MLITEPIFQCYSFAISMEDSWIVKLKWSILIFTYFSSFALAALIHNAYGQRDDSFYCHATVGITATKITSKCKFWLLFSSVYSAYVVDVKKNCGHSTLLATIRVCYKQSANTYLPSYLTILVSLGFLLPLSFSFFLCVFIVYLFLWLHCKWFDHKNYRDWKLRGLCRENLHYLWKRAVRIAGKPHDNYKKNCRETP